MATHSSTLAWKIPWTEEPGRLQSMGSWRVRHNWSKLAAAAAADQFSRSVMSDSLQPHGLQHARLPITNSRSLLKLMAVKLVMPFNYLILCHPFSSCLQSSPASGSFPVSQFFSSGSQNIGASASASVLSMNIQHWFPLRLTGLIFLLSKGLSRVFRSTVQKHQFFIAQPSSQSNSHIHTWPQEKP